jgi:hypothetical protein
MAPKPMSARPKVQHYLFFSSLTKIEVVALYWGIVYRKYKDPSKQIETANANHCHCFRYFSRKPLNQSHFQNRRHRYFPCKNYFVVVIIKVIKVINIDVIEMMTPWTNCRTVYSVLLGPHRPRHFGPNNKTGIDNIFNIYRISPHQFL